MQCRGGECSDVEDSLADEQRVIVRINSIQVLSLYCSPFQIRELVTGFIMTEGMAEGICTERMSIVYGPGEITVDVDAEGEVRTEGGSVTSGCVGGMTFEKPLSEAARTDNVTVSHEQLKGLFRQFVRRSHLYEETGCMHAAALCEPQEMICFAEDIGRHNAVDKVIGEAILEGEDFRGKIMLASGRLSSEIATKCAKWGIPVIVSRAAPTALAVRIADEQGITLLGFLRGERFNAYCHAHRIVS